MAAAAAARGPSWRGSIGRGFCLLQPLPPPPNAAHRERSSASDQTLTDATQPGRVLRVSASSERAPQVVHSQELRFDLGARRVEAEQAVSALLVFEPAFKGEKRAPRFLLWQHRKGLATASVLACCGSQAELFACTFLTDSVSREPESLVCRWAHR